MLKAVIFDMDGVISDTEKTHIIVETTLLKRFGVEVDGEELSDKYAGVPSKVFMKKILDDHGVKTDIDKLIDEKWAMVTDLITQKLDPVPGVLELIDKLKNKGFKLAVGSSSTPKFVNLTLDKLDIKDKFDAVVTIDDVENGKPSPDIFLLAAKKLGVAPEECLVIEDGRSGMQAAKSAGMRCVGLVKDKNRKDYPADFLVENLDEINLDNL